MYKGLRIGLALGGGGARAFAHLGILRMLKKSNIEVDIIAGSSMGSLIPIAYMQHSTFDKTNTTFKQFVLRFAQEFKKMQYAEAQEHTAMPLHKRMVKRVDQAFKFFHLVTKPNVEDATIIKNIVDQYIHPGNLETLPQKMYVCTVDAVTGQQVLINKGNIQESIIAATSIAGYFPPIPLGDRLLTDSQQVYPVPIQAFYVDPVDIIISVDVTSVPTQHYVPNTGLDMLFRQGELIYHHIHSELHYCSDIVIQPDLQGIHWTDFHQLDSIMRAGVTAAKDLISDIDQLAKNKSRITPIENRPWHTFGHSGLERTIVRSFEPYIFGGSNA
ncbi:MAG: patatin-like phospholipase family protein [Fibrobacterales bacterium]